MRQSSLHKAQMDNPDIIRCKEAVMATLSYFDIFYYPLTAAEIKQYLSVTAEDSMIRQCLDELVKEEKIFFLAGFYTLQNNPLLSHRRKQGNLAAEKLLQQAMRTGRFLFQFPFVRAIGISGSLSKNYADEKSDIDFFVITKADRLWIARTLMHCYKKLTFLTGRQHFHCMNYYIDEKAMRLNEENIFTAIELKTLLPVSGQQTMQQFFAANQWANRQLPSCAFREQEQKDPRRSIIKRVMEWLFGGLIGKPVEQFLFYLTQKRWQRKEAKGKRNKKGQAMGLITGKHFARSNPGDFQEKVLALYEEKLWAARPSIMHKENIRASSAT